MLITDVRTMRLRGPDPHGIGGKSATSSSSTCASTPTPACTDSARLRRSRASRRSSTSGGTGWWVRMRSRCVRSRALLYGALPVGGKLPGPIYHEQDRDPGRPSRLGAQRCRDGALRCRRQGARATGGDAAGWLVPGEGAHLPRSQRRRGSDRPRAVAHPRGALAGRRVRFHQVRPRAGRVRADRRPVEPLARDRPDRAGRRTSRGGARHHRVGRRDRARRPHVLRRRARDPRGAAVRPVAPALVRGPDPDHERDLARGRPPQQPGTDLRAARC